MTVVVKNIAGHFFVFVGAPMLLWATLTGEVRAQALVATQVAQEQSTADLSTPTANRARLQQRIIEFVVNETAKRHPGAQVSSHIELTDAIKPPCTTPLISQVGKAGMGHMSLMLRCEHSRWTAYVSAGNAIQIPVMVVTRPISRGALVNADDVSVELRPMDGLRQGYLHDRTSVIGQQARRALSAGQILYQRALQAPNLVLKGERVRIEAAMGHSVIAALGEAKANGVAGQQILVKNLQSGRTIQAWVLGRGRVSTRPPLT